MVKRDLFPSFSDTDNDCDSLTQQMFNASACKERHNPHASVPLVVQEIRSKKSVSSFGDGTVDVCTLSGRDREESDGNSSLSIQTGSKRLTARCKVTQGKANDGEENKSIKRTCILDEVDDESDGIRINKQYAAKYDEVKRRKELRQLTQKYGDNAHGVNSSTDEEDEEDEEDDGAVLLTESKELSFAKAFLAIRRAVAAAHAEDKREKTTGEAVNAAGPDLLSSELSFFPSIEEQMRENAEVFAKAMRAKRQQRKKFTLADEYRRGITNSAEDGGVENVDVAERQRNLGNSRIQPNSAHERELRDSFLKSVAESDPSFFVQPANPPASDERGDVLRSEAKELLADAFVIGSEAKGYAPLMDNADDAFLRDFFVEELWKPENNRKGKKTTSSSQKQGDPGDKINTAVSSESDCDLYTGEEGSNYAALAELARAEEDEHFYADAAIWEREYQERAYRHLDEEAEHVQSFPRAIGEHATGLLRKTVQSSRKEARLRRVQRLREVREQQLAELRRLKTLKRQEIEAQRALIASVAGITRRDGYDSSGKVPSKGVGSIGRGCDDAALKRIMAIWSEKDLDEEFDPKKFDSKMAQIFDDEYYDEQNVDEEEMAYFEDEEDSVEDEGGEVGQFQEKSACSEGKSLRICSTHHEADASRLTKEDRQNDAFFVDADRELLYPSVTMHESVAPEQNQRERIERMVFEHHPAVADKEEVLPQLQATLKAKEEEYFQLHHESTLHGGAIKTRFKYREVAPEDFTLSVEEILAKDDRQLNMLVPMNCYAAYLSPADNMRDRMRVERRRRKGFREIDSSRGSRRYGKVAKTSLVDMNMKEEEGEKWSQQVRMSLRRMCREMELDEEDGVYNRHKNGRNSGAVDISGVCNKSRFKGRRLSQFKRARNEEGGGGAWTREARQ
ncbi:putative KRI1 like family KRI1 like family C terminal [Trypanosoma vivax]|nr:putative KRI1 like family KRI1 like family C terminal [Trypanosoma vivax]